jgi:membrane fusion protein, multidrug efflux system
MASTKAARGKRFYVLGFAVILSAASAIAYFQFGRTQEIGTVRGAKAGVAAVVPRVEVVTTTAGPRERIIKLLGDARSGASTTLYSKIAGYLKAMHVDKGDRVSEGQVVAEIESPELEQQYAAAAADFANKQRNLTRIRGLFDKGNSTQVALLQAQTDATVAENNVAVLGTMKSYQVMRAPFAGRVTSRFIDPGMLVTNAANNWVAAMPVMTISDDTKVRVYAYLQQVDVPFVHVGDAAELSDASNPDRKLMAKVTRMTGELEQRTRTMLIEVHVDNSSKFVVPGSFAYVTIRVPIESRAQIPVTALLNRGNERVVAVLDNDTVRMRPVKVASTDGGTISLAEGLKPGEKIAINVPDEVTDGSRVQPVAATR